MITSATVSVGAGRTATSYRHIGTSRGGSTSVGEHGRGACPRASPATRATGIAAPSATRSAGRVCGGGISSAHGSRVAEQVERGADREVAGHHVVELVPRHRERHRHAGADARAVRRGDRRAAGAGRVDEHLAAAVGLEERGRGDGGVEQLGAPGDGPRRARPRRRPSSRRRPARTRARPSRRCVFTAPARPRSASARRTRWAAATAAAKPPSSGGSRSSTRCVGRSRCAASASVGWYSTARWLANHSSVRRSSHSAYDTVALGRLGPDSTVSTKSGVYFGTFFCMNGR